MQVTRPDEILHIALWHICTARFIFVRFNAAEVPISPRHAESCHAWFVAKATRTRSQLNGDFPVAKTSTRHHVGKINVRLAFECHVCGGGQASLRPSNTRAVPGWQEDASVDVISSAPIQLPCADRFVMHVYVHNPSVEA